MSISFGFVDQQTLDVEIERLRDELKPKVSKLHKMEGTRNNIRVMWMELQKFNIILSCYVNVKVYNIIINR